MSAGNRHLGYKDALNAIEDRSPGTKAAFYVGFLERAAELVAHVGEEEREDLHPCPSCGAPTTARLCAFCRMVQRSGGEPRRLIPVSGDPLAGDPVARDPVAGDLVGGSGEWVPGR